MNNDPAPRQSKSDVTPDWDAIARFLAGESSAEEAVSVRRWLDMHAVDRELVERLDGMATIDPPADLDVDAALQRVHTRIAEAANKPRLKVDRGRGIHAPAPRPWGIVGVAAVAAAAAAFAFVTLRDKPSGSPPAATTATVATATARVYRTNIGQRDSIVLSDSSRVILGPDSRLTVPATYGATERAVELQGDGYFQVRHDASKPFSVRVGSAVVEDIGTTFAVESDARNTPTVSVMAGSVRLRADGSAATGGAVLAAGDRGSMTASGKVSAFPHTVASDDAAWTTGRLVFHDAPLSSVAAEIHRWYGVNLHIADSSLLNRHISNSFNGEPVDQVLKVIGLTLGLRIERQGDSAIVYAHRGPVSTR